jgi:hypothetical protein
MDTIRASAAASDKVPTLTAATLYTPLCLILAGMVVFHARKKLARSDKPTASIAKGTRIEVFWPAMDEWYPGTIKSSAVQDGTRIHQIRYDDKWVEWRELTDTSYKVLARNGASDLAGLSKGARVKVFWPAMDEWYPGTIKNSALQDGVPIHQIRYDDKWVEWRELTNGDWERLPIALPKRRSRAAVSPTRISYTPISHAPMPPKNKVWLSPDFKPSAHFQANGYEMHMDLLDEAAVEALRSIQLGVTRPINGEVGRRQRPLEANRPTHTRPLRCLDAFLSARGLLAFEPSVLMSTSVAKRQRPHRDRGQGSLVGSFQEGTHLWVAPGSHLQPGTDPSAWESQLRRVNIPPGCVLLFDPALVHAGGDASCPPRLHSYTLPNDRGGGRSHEDAELMPKTGTHCISESESRVGARPMRADFGSW